jgi:hypothetical protein
MLYLLYAEGERNVRMELVLRKTIRKREVSCGEFPRWDSLLRTRVKSLV